MMLSISTGVETYRESQDAAVYMNTNTHAHILVTASPGVDVEVQQ